MLRRYRKIVIQENQENGELNTTTVKLRDNNTNKTMMMQHEVFCLFVMMLHTPPLIKPPV